ncbi:MAG: hypothetical protein WC508_01205 [Patescibacteria group bacterium]
MSKRTIIIFSIFVIVAMIGVTFAVLYRQQVDALVNHYSASLAICGNILDEKECFLNDFCEGIYQPACIDCKEMVFKSCHRVSRQTAASLTQQKGLCQNTGGQWYRNQLGNFCLCDNAGTAMTFDRSSGCVSR